MLYNIAMALDGIFIKHLVDELKSNLEGGRIDNIDEISKTDYQFVIRSKGKNNFLFLSVSYNNPTLFISSERLERLEDVSSFTMFLRKHFIGSIVASINQLNNDRIIEFEIETKNEFYGKSKKSIIIELIGRFSNLIVLDENKVILEAIKQLSIIENNSRGIMRGLKYIPLKNDKLSPYDRESINNTFKNIDSIYTQNIVNNISGISPFLAGKLVESYSSNNLPFYDILESYINRYEPTLYVNDYYYFDILGNGKHYNSLSDVLSSYYNKFTKEKNLKDQNIKIYQCVNSNIKRLEKKILKLNEEYTKDISSEDLKIKGDILMSNAYLDMPKKDKISLLNYYTNENIDISLDPSKTLKDNALMYYKKYKKAKAAISHLDEQLLLSNNELEYFKLLLYQLKNASLKDIQEIKQELILSGYIKEKVYKKKKKYIPNYLVYTVDDCTIYVGKNNIQNNYLTHKLALRSDLWFHIKSGHGSHVIVTGDNKMSENVIRYAANLAALYSEASKSSSVPVDYTLVKNIKKIPGKKGCFVSYTNYKTIYIDPKD